MKNIGKAMKTAQLEGRQWRKELNMYLRNYRATPHSVTDIPPATALNGYPLKTKLPQISIHKDDTKLTVNDQLGKSNMKYYAERRRNIKESNLKIGDKVLMKNITKPGKLQPKFQQEPFEIIEKKGSMVIAQRGEEVKARNSCHFRNVYSEEEPILVRDDEETQNNIVDSGEQQIESYPPDSLPIPECPTSESQPQNSPSRSPKNQPISDPQSRPKRSVKIPKHFKDFEVKIPKLVGKK